MKQFVFYFILLSSFGAQATTSIAFIDACSEEEVKVSTPNGVRLTLKISELDPDDEVNVTVIIRPSLPTEAISENDQVVWNFNYGKKPNNWLGRSIYHIDAEGILDTSFSLPKAKWMRKVAERHKGYNIWDAEVFWSQPKARTVGNSTTTFFNSPSEGPYYQILSGRICQWEGRPSIASKVYENTGDQNMMLIRQTSAIWEQGSSRGMALGYNNYHGNIHPLAQFSLSSSFLGWIFKDWQVQADSSFTTTLERTYTIKRNDVGVFVSRLAFGRHQARKFVWKEGVNTCGRYEPVSSGYLDVGNQKNGDFVVVPKHIAGDVTKLTEFISKSSPVKTNCNWMPSDQRDTTDAIPSGKNGMLFYYVR